MKRFFKIVITLVILLLLAGAGYLWYRSRGAADAVVLRTAPVKLGNLVVTVPATGTVEPEETVDVGAQVAGLIVSFGKDDNGKPIDYDSVVDEGTVLAQIDDSVYKSQEDEAKAQVELANAGLQSAQANLEQMNAKLAQAKNDWDRAQKLGPSEALAQTSYDSYKAAYETAKANVGVAQAAIQQAKASIDQANAGLQGAERNLGYCTIKSPVKGVIIDRRVDIGQTVVSSLSAPSLFLIAKDLTRMEIWVAVNEADVGKIKPDEPVTFTVDAFPGETFQGQVGKIRLNASMTQNVVTYTVEVNTDNSNGRLLPYLTADLHFEVARRDGVLMVPNAALQWRPSVDQVAPQYRQEAQNPTARQPKPEGGQQPVAQSGQPAAQASQPAGGTMGHGVVYVTEGTYVRPIPVRVGLTDDVDTEVQGEGLAEGTEVVIGTQAPQVASAQSDTTNPFVPRFPRRGGAAGGAGAGAPGAGAGAAGAGGGAAGAGGRARGAGQSAGGTP